jgi:hypothetical protein
MTYMTQGVVTFHAPARTISITPTPEYEVTHDKSKYTIFVEKVGDAPPNSKIFPITKIFGAPIGLEPLLIQAAFNKVRLSIAIDNDDAVSQVIIPASS